MTTVLVFSVCLSYLSEYLKRGEYWAIALFSGLAIIMLLSIGVIQLLPQWPSEQLAFRVSILIRLNPSPV